MATSKHASIRYEVLDRYLQRQSEDNTEKKLREYCCDAVAEQDPRYEAAEISLRTFRGDIAYLKNLSSQHDVDILCQLGSKGYYYRQPIF